MHFDIPSHTEDDMLIVCLYVDDLIFTGHRLKLVLDFWEAMISHFEMTDLGLMSYFLGIEVCQKDCRIYAWDYAFFLGLGVFSWSSKKQVIALSTVEVEYMAAMNSAT